MFVRINSTPNSPRKSIQIVESVSTGDKVRQKIVRYVGIAMNDYEQERLVTLANDIIVEIMKERESPELFNNIEKPQLGRKKRKQLSDILPPDQVSLTDIREDSRIIEGVDDIAGCAYDELGFGQLLQQGANKLLKDVVLARLVFPESKHKLQQILTKQFDKEYDLNIRYREICHMKRLLYIKHLGYIAAWMHQFTYKTHHKMAHSPIVHQINLQTNVVSKF